MTENKRPEDELPEGFNEDFDFGEAEQRAPLVHASEKQGPSKNLLVGVSTLIIIVVAVLGYKFYPSSSAKATPKVATATQPTIKNAPATASTPQAQTPTSTTITPAPVPQSQTAAQAPTAKPVTPSANQTFGDIAQAFSSADNPTATTPSTPSQPLSPQTIHPTQTVPPVAQTTTTKEGTIQDLQKELFAPELPNAAPAPLPSMPGTIATTSDNNTQLNESLNKLNQQIDYISNKIKYLDSYTREMSDNLNKINETIHAMDNRVSTLTRTTSTLSKDVGHVREVLREDGLELSAGEPPPSRGRRSSINDARISIEEPEYLVHAVIPGRAWLKSSKGQILTVTEGDTIGNYGKILVIDAANGVVLTSSGVTFR